MIKLRHQQPSLWHRGLAEDNEGLWEPWRPVDELLEDEWWIQCTKRRVIQSCMRPGANVKPGEKLRLLL